MAGDVRAQTPTLPHYPGGDVQFRDALTAEQLSREFLLNVAPDTELFKQGRVKESNAQPKATVTIFGSINNNAGSPLCALVLANGQFMFSCQPTGQYSLTVPQDTSGQVTLFGFADGHFPYKRVFGGSGGRYDMTLIVANVTPPPVVNQTITFTITDGCNNAYPINYKFYDETNNLVWPSSTSFYYTSAYNASYTSNLSCIAGATVCYGARTTSPDVYWGVDLDNSKYCSDCCITCQNGNSLSRRLTC